MKSLSSHNVIHLLFLELLSITPILIIVGNIAPPFFIKWHHLGLGLIFLGALAALAMDGFKKWILYMTLFFVLVQFTLEQWHVKGLVDYFFGPFVFVLILDLVVNQRLPKVTLEKYEHRFYFLLWVPAGIAVLQFFEIIPITFWNAQYINYAYFGDLAIPRPNGLLYHGSELSVIICFLALFQFFRKDGHAFWILILLIIISAMTYFKALTGCILILFLYHIAFLNRGIFAQLKLITIRRLVFYSLIFIGFISWMAIQFFSKIHTFTGYYFPSAMLTGRGAIWNIYLERMKEFTWWNYLVGNGMGSSFDIFATYATPETWYLLNVDPNTDLDYDTHNAFLSVFINSGLVGMTFIFFLFRMLYRQVKTWLPSEKRNKRLFFGIFILPLMTIGITIPIYENAIFWSALGFLIVRWHLNSTVIDGE